MTTEQTGVSAMSAELGRWRPIETQPADMLAYLFLCNGITVEGFRDATGQMLVRNERHEWRKMRSAPTHWMPLPPPPATHPTPALCGPQGPHQSGPQG